MILYRVEHESDGLGIWRSRKVSEISIESYIIMKNYFLNMDQPLYDEGILRDPETYEYCAFTNEKTFKRFFNLELLNHLIEKGFKVLALSVKPTIYSNLQALYKKEDVKKVLDITKLVTKKEYWRK